MTSDSLTRVGFVALLSPRNKRRMISLSDCLTGFLSPAGMGRWYLCEAFVFDVFDLFLSSCGESERVDPCLCDWAANV